MRCVVSHSHVFWVVYSTCYRVEVEEHPLLKLRCKKFKEWFIIESRKEHVLMNRSTTSFLFGTRSVRNISVLESGRTPDSKYYYVPLLFHSSSLLYHLPFLYLF